MFTPSNLTPHVGCVASSMEYKSLTKTWVLYFGVELYLQVQSSRFMKTCSKPTKQFHKKRANMTQNLAQLFFILFLNLVLIDLGGVTNTLKIQRQ